VVAAAAQPPAPRADPAALGPLFVKLSPREIEILDLVARGNSNKIIGRKLHISDQTVKNHVSAILRKLEVNDRTEAVVYALRNGWIRIETPAS
jgi:DNA-binding NarL/FixJ family response regulator